MNSKFYTILFSLEFYQIWHIISGMDLGGAPGFVLVMILVLILKAESKRAGHSTTKLTFLTSYQALDVRLRTEQVAESQISEISRTPRRKKKQVPLISIHTILKSNQDFHGFLSDTISKPENTDNNNVPSKTPNINEEP